MKIDMNKNFETQFKNEVWKGFTGSEVLCGVIALALAGSVVFGVWFFTDLPIHVCTYFGIPVMIPVVAVGNLKYQGHSMGNLLQELKYFYHTRELSAQREERSAKCERSFCMEQRNRKEGRKTGRNSSRKQ